MWHPLSPLRGERQSEGVLNRFRINKTDFVMSRLFTAVQYRRQYAIPAMRLKGSTHLEAAP
jgi:hypothetical protein